MEQPKIIIRSQEMRIANTKKAKLSAPAASMYLAGAVKLSRAEEVSKRANRGKGWVSA